MAETDGTGTIKSMSRSLFETPLAFGKIVIPGRIAMAPMTREYCPNGIPGEDVVTYYKRRAEGGAALIITEGMAVNSEGAHDGPIPLLYDARAIGALERVTSAVHQSGAKIFAQLWHVGVQDAATRVNEQTVRKRPARVGPSGLDPQGNLQGRPMTLADIDRTIEDFAAAAVAAKRAGFDGAEIHGAHGYLPDQFMSLKTNRRTDGYGGDFAGRIRFTTELVAACRKAVGEDFALILRFSQWKSFDYTARIAKTPDELAALLQPVADAGLDGFHCSTRRYWEPAFSGETRTLAGWAKHLTSKPVIAVGSATLATDFKSDIESDRGGVAESKANPGDIDDIIRHIVEGEFDMIAVGRAMIANPNWAALVKEGRESELLPFHKSHLERLE